MKNYVARVRVIIDSSYGCGVVAETINVNHQRDDAPTVEDASEAAIIAWRSMSE